MRRLALFLFFASPAFGQAHEILRPTADLNSTITALGCSGTSQSTTAMTNSYDSAGLATSSGQITRGTRTSTTYRVRIFKTWVAPTQSYTALSLKVNSSSVETFVSGSTGYTNVSYSLNSGSSWITVHEGINWSQTTDSITLSTAQDFTKVQVAICVQSNAGGDSLGDLETMTVWDIWTDGTYAGGASGSGSSQGIPAIQPILISFEPTADLRRKYV